jgi:hypothetical protein
MTVARGKRHEDSSSFTLASLTNLVAIPVVTGGIALIGFYYVTNSTLLRYGDDIKNINVKLESTALQISKKTEQDDAARTKIRDDFLASQLKTVEGISKLDTRLAVAETQQTVTNQQLSKIVESLNKIVATSSTGFLPRR